MDKLYSFEDFVTESYLNENYVADITFAKRGKNLAELRRLAKNVSGDYNKWEAASDKDVSKFLNAYVKRQRENKKYERLNKNITKELDRLNNSDNLVVDSHASTPKGLRLQFVGPIFHGENGKESLAFLKGAKRVIVKAQPTPKGYTVFYSGTAENDRGEEITFKDIDNGLSVNMG